MSGVEKCLIVILFVGAACVRIITEVILAVVYWMGAIVPVRELITVLSRRGFFRVRYVR